MLPDIITKARARLLVRAPFFGSIALGLGWIEDPGVGTMATDGRSVWFNTEWCDEQGVGRTTGVIAHEVFHVVNKHHLRRGSREPGRWNRAADLMTNRVLEADKFELPSDGLFDREGRFAGLPTEVIYDRLEEEERAAAAAAGEGAGQHGRGPVAAGGSRDMVTAPERVGGVRRAETWGEVRDLTRPDGRPLGAAERRQAENDLDVRIRQAVAAARRAGKMPGRFSEVVEAATDRVDWRDKLRTTFDGVLRGDLSWVRPNRRFIQHGLYLPGWRRSGAGRVALLLDTSGSISRRELAVYVAAVLGLLEETGPEVVALVQCDSAVRHVTYLRPGDSFDSIEVHGRGGTRFQPGFDWVDESGFNPSVIIYATDLDSSDTPADPGVAVIWLTPRRGRPVPFGTVVHASV